MREGRGGRRGEGRGGSEGGEESEGGREWEGVPLLPRQLKPCQQTPRGVTMEHSNTVYSGVSQTR